MPLSYSTSVGDGSNKSFTFTFAGQDAGYFDPASITVLVDGLEVPFTLLSSNTLETEEAPADGSVVRIQRSMPTDLPYSDFRRGNNFGPDILNRSFLQQLYLLQELLDGIYPEGYTVQTAVRFMEQATFEGGLLSIAPDPDNPDSVITFGAADARYISSLGGLIEGPLYVQAPEAENSPAQYGQLLTAVDNFNSQIANLQSQLVGAEPPSGSRESPIAWHDQSLKNTTSIPAGKNAATYGPTFKMEAGSKVIVGEGSFWTIL